MISTLPMKYASHVSVLRLKPPCTGTYDVNFIVPCARILRRDGGQPITEELLPPEKIVVPISDRAIDFRKELKALLNSIMANYGQFMEMLIR